MAAVVPFIPYIAAAFTAVSAIQQGNAARETGEYNAAIAERNAGIARDQANADAEAQGRFARQKIGAARAAYGASGVTLEGSPIDVLAMSASNAELDRLNILHAGEIKAMGYRDTAQLDRMKGEAAQSKGYGDAASAILTGTTQSRKPKPQIGYTIGDYGSDIDMGL